MAVITCKVCGEQKDVGRACKANTCYDCLDKGLKWCSLCNTVKTADAFYKKSGSLSCYCKQCQCARDAEHQRKRYATDPEYRQREIEYHRNRRATDEKYRERQRELNRAWYRDKRATDDEYRRQCSERSAAYKRDRYATDEAYRLKQLLKGQARRGAAKCDLSVAQWFALCDKFNNSCCYCGAAENLTLEHIVPLSKDGRTTWTNLAVACKHCNSSKGPKDLLDWYPKQHFFSKGRLNKIIQHTNDEDSEQ